MSFEKECQRLGDEVARAHLRVERLEDEMMRTHSDLIKNRIALSRAENEALHYKYLYEASIKEHGQIRGNIARLPTRGVTL